jgi:aryl-alcohol dehydrogenase-like predicted oxidoreductase
MKYRYLGKSGLLVSRVCLGTMTYGNDEWGCDLKESKEITAAFIDHGGNFIDTADLYSAGVSEEFLAKAIKDRNRSDLVIATKCWFPTSDDVNARGLSRKHIIDACEASLKRLDTDYIDLLYAHGPDPFTPMEETIAAFDDLIRSGKVRYIGCSNWFGWQVVKYNAMARANNCAPFIAGQYLYNLIRRDIETEIIPACVDQGVGITPWSPLASGLLTGKYRGKDKPDEGTRHAQLSNLLVPRFWWDDALKLVDTLVETAESLGPTPSVLALSWLLYKDSVPSVVVGARTKEQIIDTIQAGDYDIDTEVYQAFNNLLPHDHGFPNEWMKIALAGNLKKHEFHPLHTQGMPVIDNINLGQAE